MGWRSIHVYSGEGDGGAYRWELSWAGSGSYVVRPGVSEFLFPTDATNMVASHLTVAVPGGGVTGTTTVNVAISPGSGPLGLQLSDHWQTGSSYQVVRSAAGSAAAGFEFQGRTLFWLAFLVGLGLASLGWRVTLKR